MFPRLLQGVFQPDLHQVRVSLFSDAFVPPFSNASWRSSAIAECLLVLDL
jgi:hypothetical protein